MGQHILVCGPTKSGKSEWAETLAVRSQQSVCYVATARPNPDDQDWQTRIDRHRRRRPAGWKTLETPVELAAALQQGTAVECWLVDSLGTWLANCLDQDDRQWQHTTRALMQAIAHFPGTLIMVAEETGWGVVPAYPVGRQFRDRLGQLTRQLGQMTDVTYLVVAGYAVKLSEIGAAVPVAAPPIDE